ncbi:MAG: hypothetical protein N2C14_19195 [Planctomycetales bacterium]
MAVWRFFQGLCNQFFPQASQDEPAARDETPKQEAPAHDESLCQLIRQGGVRRVVEIGVGSGQRAARMIHEALRQHAPVEIHYVGIDSFEGGGKASLKDVYQLLRPTGARLRLIPGDALSGLRQVANDLPDTDLLVISSDQTDASLQDAWAYMPRMLHAESQVFREEFDPETKSLSLRSISVAEIDALADQVWKRRRLAA